MIAVSHRNLHSHCTAKFSRLGKVPCRVLSFIIYVQNYVFIDIDYIRSLAKNPSSFLNANCKQGKSLSIQSHLDLVFNFRLKTPTYLIKDTCLFERCSVKVICISTKLYKANQICKYIFTFWRKNSNSKSSQSYLGKFSLGISIMNILNSI